MITIIACRRFLTETIILIAVTAYTMCLTGCAVPTALNYAQGVVSHGSTIEDMKKRACNSPEFPCQDWSKPDYYRENGNAVYREIRGPNCWRHWEVSPEGRIVGFRLEGRGCGPGVPSGQPYSPWYGPHGPEPAAPSTK